MIAHAVARDPATAVSRTTAQALRRGFLIAAPVLAGAFAIVGVANDPAIGESGRPLWEKYAANADSLQWKSFGLHWSYAFWTMTAFMLAGRVRDRGVWLANVAGLLAFVGATTLPGLLIADFYDSAIGQVAGAATTERVNDAMQAMWGMAAIALPGVIGALLALPIAALAAWRAGIIPVWAFAVASAAVAVFILSGVTVWGATLMAVLFAVFAYALARSDRL